jgi:uncharacterized membrane protein YfcA
MKALKQLISPFSFLIFLIWPVTFIYFDLWILFKENYFMTITMIVGSFIAGATSEGGGAVAFPVMTLLFNIAPSVARDFSFMIQSFGMTSASLLILRKKIPILKEGIIYPALGAILGNYLGYNYIVGLFSPPALKMFFCSFWLSFVFVLIKSIKTSTQVDKMDSTPFNISILLFSGVLGGIVTALSGTGLDILTFSVLTLYFNICVKVATPSSVILMAINSVCAWFMKEKFFGGVDPVAFEYLLICIPVVIFFAPLGSFFIKDKNKVFVTLFLVTTISIQFVTAYLILPLSLNLIYVSLSSLAFGILLFSAPGILKIFKSRKTLLLKS